MKENYDTFFDELIKHEGGFTDDERDPGNQRGAGHGNRGSTNLGVTAKVWAEWTGKPAPIEVMKQLTKDDIKPMYKARYWDVVQGDHLPSGVDISVADFGVNAGPSRGETIAAGGDGNTGWQDRVKNSIATVANDPALTFFLKKVHPTFIHQMPNLPKVISTTFKLRLIQFKQFIVL